MATISKIIAALLSALLFLLSPGTVRAAVPQIYLPAGAGATLRRPQPLALAHGAQALTPTTAAAVKLITAAGDLSQTEPATAHQTGEALEKILSEELGQGRAFLADASIPPWTDAEHPRILRAPGSQAAEDVFEAARASILRVNQKLAKGLLKFPVLFLDVANTREEQSFDHGGLLELAQKHKTPYTIVDEEGSKPILYHEYGHTLFTANAAEALPQARELIADCRRYLYEIWHGERSGLGPVLSAIRKQIALHPVACLWKPHQELFADLVAVLMTQNPSVMRQVLGAAVLGRTGAMLKGRDFANGEPFGVYDLADEHYSLGPTRSFLGRYVLDSKAWAAGPETLRRVLRVLMKDVRRRLGKSTEDRLEAIWHATAIPANRKIIQDLRMEFGLSRQATPDEMFYEE